MTTAPHPEPVELRHEKGARRLVITWDDGHLSANASELAIYTSHEWQSRGLLNV